MKTFLKLTGVLVLLGLLASSCSKGRLYDETSWYTETGPGHSITATFSEGSQKCLVLVVTGECGLGCEYEVEWAGRNSFKLVFKEEGQTYVSYKGVINGDTMLLDKLRHVNYNVNYTGLSDELRYEIQETYELKRKN